MQNYERRTYRLKSAAEGLVPFRVQIDESDLFILATRKLEQEAFEELKKLREQIESWGDLFPDFFASLTPLDMPSSRFIPEVVREMYRAASYCGVGPMAAVAGAVAEAVGKRLLESAKEVIVENGGDIFAFTRKERKALVFAAASPFSEKLTVALPRGRAVGLCTSSGTVGHSLSFGKADAVVVLADNAAVADAAATALGNLVQTPQDVNLAIERAKELPVEGVLIIIGETMGVWGDIEIDTA